MPRVIGDHLTQADHRAEGFLLTLHILARRIWLGGQDPRAGGPVSRLGN